MIKRLLAMAILTLAAGACAPVMQQPTSVACLEAATRAPVSCAAALEQHADEQQQKPQEKQTPPPGPGKKDFTVWMILLTMGFGALYLMAFK